MPTLDWLNRASAFTTAARVVYGDACRLRQERLKLANVTFKHIPFDVRAR